MVLVSRWSLNSWRSVMMDIDAWLAYSYPCAPGPNLVVYQWMACHNPLTAHAATGDPSDTNFSVLILHITLSSVHWLQYCRFLSVKWFWTDQRPRILVAAPTSTCICSIRLVTHARAACCSVWPKKSGGCAAACSCTCHTTSKCCNEHWTRPFRSPKKPFWAAAMTRNQAVMIPSSYLSSAAMGLGIVATSARLSVCIDAMNGM